MSDAAPSPRFGHGRSGALRGLKVLELAERVAGPMTGMLLADEGAAVLKIERGEGDPARLLPAFSIWNRGKRSATIDVSHDDGCNTLLVLIDEADVVLDDLTLTSERPLDLADILGRNPKLVYCTMPGFVPELALPPETSRDPLIMAMLGFETSITFSDGQPPGEDLPLHTPLPVASVMAAVTAAGAITAALAVRDKHGVGQHVEAPLYSASVAAMSIPVMSIDEELTRRTKYRLPMTGRFVCGDGRYIQLQGPEEHFVRDLMVELGHPEWAEEAVSSFKEGVDPAGFENWRTRLQDVFSESDAIDWEERLNDRGLVCTMVRSVEEWMSSSQARVAELVVDVPDVSGKLLVQPGRAIAHSSVPHEPLTPPPKLGADTQLILDGLPGIARPCQPSGSTIAPDSLPMALNGVRVLDLCIVLAGPSCGRTLGEFGADVVKIDDPNREVGRQMSLDVNRGKRSILLDLRDPVDKKRLWSLIEDADVLLENYRTGSFATLGFDFDSLISRKPDLVYSSVNCFGFGGPWSSRKGYDQNAQAAVGIQMRRGGRGAQPGVLTYPVNDYVTGLLAAYGVMLALRDRDQTGRPQRVTASLVQAAGLVQSCFMFDYAGYVRHEPEGMELLGDSPLSRLYQAGDGQWLYLSCDDKAFFRMIADPAFEFLSSESGSGGASQVDEATLAKRLEWKFSSKPRDYWIRLLRTLGVGVAPRLSVPEFVPMLREAGLLVTQRTYDDQMVEHVGASTVTLSATPKRLGALVPTLGRDTEAVLTERRGAVHVHELIFLERSTGTTMDSSR